MLGLADVLRQAESLRAVSGTTPGEIVAIIEYLLGICYASGTYPRSSSQWTQWVRGRQSLSAATQWLLEQPNQHWNLFDPATPLGQNALLAAHLDEHGCGPAQLVLEQAGDYLQFFDHHHLEHPQPLPADEAFRAMLVQHAYGPGMRGRISGKLLGKTLNNLATGRLATRIRVLALGETLADTLRLNLHPYPNEPGIFNTTWTQTDRRRFDQKPTGRTPRGPADLHSLLGRSILLRPLRRADGSLAVDRVLVGAGELLAPLPDTYLQDAVLVPLGKTDSAPLRPTANKALWREAHALYAAVAENPKDNDLYSRLTDLPGARIRLWAVGLVSEDNKLLTWLADSFPFVNGREQGLWDAAKHGSDVADFVAEALRKAADTARLLAYPNANPEHKKHQLQRFDARAEHFAAAAAPFHQMLEAVADGESAEDAADDFARTTVHTAHRLLEHRLDTLPPNSRGFRTRAAAQNRLGLELRRAYAPRPIREVVAS